MCLRTGYRLAVNDARLVRVEFDTALPHPSFQMSKNPFGLFFCSGMGDSVIGAANVARLSGEMLPRH